MELSDAWPLCLCTQLQSGLSELPLVPTIAGLAFPRVHVVHAHSHTPQALVLLQLHANLNVLLVASWQELSQHVCAFTRALSQLPSKYVPLGGGGVETGQGWRAADGVLKASVWVSSFQAAPGLPGLFFLHSRALGLRSASDQRWLWAQRCVVATNQTVQPGQHSCG